MATSEQQQAAEDVLTAVRVLNNKLAAAHRLDLRVEMHRDYARGRGVGWKAKVSISKDEVVAESS